METVVLLSKDAKGPVDLCSVRTEVERRMVDSRKVKVDFSLEDMDLSEFKGKATYEQIKAYVLEQTGLKVSSLYIAQIKKKCGLDVLLLIWKCSMDKVMILRDIKTDRNDIYLIYCYLF